MHLRQRVRGRLADLLLVAKLDNVRMEMTALKDGAFDTEKGDVLYAEAFRAFGIDVEALPAADAGERIRQTTVSVELANVLDHWAMARRFDRGRADASWRHLLQVARSADSDEERNRLRDAVENQNRQALENMALAQTGPPACIRPL